MIEYAELIVSTFVKHLDDERDCHHCKIILDQIFKKGSHIETETRIKSKIPPSLLNDTSTEFDDSDSSCVLQDREH